MKISISIVFAVLFAVRLLANGGPVNPSSVVRVGDVQMINMPEVKVCREDLHIRIEGEYSVISVSYFLEGTSFDLFDNFFGSWCRLWPKNSTTSARWVSGIHFYEDLPVLGVLDDNDLLLHAFHQKVEIVTFKNSGLMNKYCRLMQWKN